MNNMAEESSDSLLLRFNNRDMDAFGEVYSKFYNELHYFTAGLYYQTEIVPADVIHDIFLRLWQSGSVRFKSLINIKVYLLAAIKNDFKNYLTHHKYIEQYKSYRLKQEDMFVAEVVESELYAIVQEALGMLPDEYAEIFRLFIEGWSAEDISKSLGKQTQTIYNIKHKTISLLKTRLSGDKIKVLTLFLH